MQKPIYTAQDEQTLMARLWAPAIADDPLAFVLFCFPWGQANTPLANFKGPRKWQREVLRDIAAHIAKTKTTGQTDASLYEVLRLAVASGRGIGKSALVAWLILWMLTTRIGSTVLVSANSENQLRSITWGELTKWQAMILNNHWWEITATKLTPAVWLTELVERDLKKGTRYWGAEGKLWSEENPDGYAGPHSFDGMMVIFDEASGIPDSIWPVASGFFTEPIPNRFWLAFSNPRRNTGYFFETFNAKRAFWNTRQVDARTVEDTDKGVYKQIIDEYGPDSPQARVEVYGEFPEVGDDQFISPRLVDDAFARTAYDDPTAATIMGVDPARGGADDTVIAVRRGRDLIAIRRFHEDDTMTVVGLVIDMIEEYDPDLTVIDEGGLGYGVLDRLKEQRYKVRGVNFGWKAKNPIMWGNKRAEMWGLMKEWLKTAAIKTDRRLKTDLIGPKTKPDSAGTVFLESKKDMKARGLASPDSADAIAVTFAYTVANRSRPEKQTRRAGNPASVVNNWMGS
jgi:hypothetical protein